MNKVLEKIANEINPLHDFDNIKFYNHIDKTSLSEKAKSQWKNLFFFTTLIKPLTRGTIMGGLLEQ